VQKKKVAEWLGIPYERMQDTHTTMKDKWKLWDVQFNVTLEDDMKEHIASWLLSGLEALGNAKNCIFVEGYNRRSFFAFGPSGTASWVKSLRRIPWIKTAGQWMTPSEIAPEEANELLPKSLVEVLQKQGFIFGM